MAIAAVGRCRGGDRAAERDGGDETARSEQGHGRALGWARRAPDLFQYVFAVPSIDTDQDEEFLASSATVVTSCAAESFPTGGLYWYEGPGDCDLESAGSLEDPVVLVSDVKVSATGKPEFFGIIYVRSTAGGELLKMNGGIVYGSVMLEGSGKMGGSPSIVYNKAVLQAIRNSPNFLRYGPVPGSWSDTLQ